MGVSISRLGQGLGLCPTWKDRIGHDMKDPRRLGPRDKGVECGGGAAPLLHGTRSG